MSTFDEFAKRIEKLEAEMVEVKTKQEEILEYMADMKPSAAIGPPVVEVPTEKIAEEAVEEAHVEVEPVEEKRELEEIGEEDVGSASEVLGEEK